MNKKIILVMVCFLMTGAKDALAVKCFFESDCTKDETCVTTKGSANGVCQAKQAITEEKDNLLGSSSIISEQGKCTFNTDCPDGGQCVKQPGALFGTCQGSGYTVGNLQAQRGAVYKDKSCFFNQDCKVGQICVKAQGSFKGACEDDFYQSNNNDIKDAKDPRALLQTFHSSDRQCLVDNDCPLREVCLKQERTVFGVCRSKSSITPTTTTTNSSSTSLNTDPFATSNSLFNK